METASFTDFDMYLLAEGKYFRSYEKMGAHLAESEGSAASASPSGRPTPIGSR